MESLINKNNENNILFQNQNHTQIFENMLNIKNNNYANSSSNNNNDNQCNFLNDNENSKFLGNNNLNINQMSNYILLQNAQSNSINNFTPQRILLSNKNYESTQTNNLSITNTIDDNNPYLFTFSKGPNPDENCDNNNNGLNTNNFWPFSNSYKGLSLFELENIKGDIDKSVVNQELACKSNQLLHINSLCNWHKNEMSLFQKYNHKELQINDFIESIQNLYKSQINQLSDINSQIELLKCFVRKKEEFNKIIGEIKDTKILREIKNL